MGKLLNVGVGLRRCVAKLNTLHSYSLSGDIGVSYCPWVLGLGIHFERVGGVYVCGEGFIMVGPFCIWVGV